MEVVEVEKLGCVVGVLWVVCSCSVLCWRIPTDGGSCLFVVFIAIISSSFFLVFISSLLYLSHFALSYPLPLPSFVS